MKPAFKNTCLTLAASAAILGSVCASADTITQDPLHAFCWGTSTCSDNGTITPTTSNPPQFGFSISPGPQTGNHFLVDILVPNNDAALASLSILGYQEGASNNMPGSGTITSTAGLVSTTAWTSGDLTAYLGLALNNGSPKNPLDAWLPSTQGVDGKATGYWVYQADLGTNQLWDNPNETNGPLLTVSSGLDLGAVVVGFLGESSTCGHGSDTYSCELYISTAQSGALFEDGPPPSVPEPGTLALFGTALGGLGLFARRFRRKA